MSWPISPKVELRHLHYFAALAEEMHFGRAAKRLAIAQPALSQQIRRIERQLGVALIDRTGRRFTLTPAGEALLIDAKEVLRLAASAVNRAQSIDRRAPGRLHVGVRSIIADILPPAIKAFHELLPDVEVVLHERISETQLAALREGHIDVGFALSPVNSDDLVAELLGTAETMLVLPEDHPLAMTSRVALGDLGDLPMILFSREQNAFFHDQIVEWCQSMGIAAVSYEAEPNAMSTLVAAGLGVSVAPSWQGGRPGQQSRIVLRQVDGPAPLAPINMITRKGDESLLVTYFRQCIKDTAHNVVLAAIGSSVPEPTIATADSRRDV